MRRSKFKTPCIFTDGACSGNPGPGGWGVIYYGKDGTVQELGGSEKSTTNNRMELLAAIRGLELAQDSDLEIHTDSQYVIRGMTQWIHGWKKRDWKTAQGDPVLNRDLWEALDELAQKRRLHWLYVKGHSGNPDNERADQIAVGFSTGIKPKLFHGPSNQYEIRENTPSKASPIYLSLVNGTLARDSTWADCEKRVKGKGGAKFKKASSPDEEAQTLKLWGVKTKTP